MNPPAHALADRGRLSMSCVIARYIKVSEVTGKRGLPWRYRRPRVTSRPRAYALSAQINTNCPKRSLKGHKRGARLLGHTTERRCSYRYIPPH